MDDPNSEIFELLGREQVTVRKMEKGTSPNLFYINGDEASLTPVATPKTGEYLWSQQATGVGHFAKEAEKLAFSNGDALSALMNLDEKYSTSESLAANGPQKSVEVLMGSSPRRVYDTPDKGILWGWEVSGYVWTKAIAAGALIVPLLAGLLGWSLPDVETEWWSYGLGLLFLSLTGILLIKDLDQPKRFLYVLLRPHWGSWLVKGGYTITVFGGLVTLLGLSLYFDWQGLRPVLNILTLVAGVLLAVYTAFLFGQAKGRDFWQSPGLALHMLIHAVMAGGAVFGILALATQTTPEWSTFLRNLLLAAVGLNLLTMLFELTTTHPTEDARYTVDMITKGRYSKLFYIGVVLVGNVLPLVLLALGSDANLLALAGVATLAGIYFTEHIWVEAPQRIPLT